MPSATVSPAAEPRQRILLRCCGYRQLLPPAATSLSHGKQDQLGPERGIKRRQQSPPIDTAEAASPVRHVRRRTCVAKCTGGGTIRPLLNSWMSSWVQSRCSRYGLRGVRIGEASHPGPPRHIAKVAQWPRQLTGSRFLLWTTIHWSDSTEVETSSPELKCRSGQSGATYCGQFLLGPELIHSFGQFLLWPFPLWAIWET